MKRKGFDCTAPARQVWEYLWPANPWPDGLVVRWEWMRANKWGDCQSIWRGTKIVRPELIRLNMRAFSDPKRIAEAFHLPEAETKGVLSTLVHEFMHARGFKRHNRVFFMMVKLWSKRLGIE